MRFTLLRGKRPAEALRLWIDFSADVAKVVGDTPASAEVKAFDPAGSDVTSNQVRDVTREGNVVYATFYGGSPSGDHSVRYTLTTSGGFVYEHDILVRIGNTV